MAINIGVAGVDDAYPRQLWAQLKEFAFAPDILIFVIIRIF